MSDEDDAGGWEPVRDERTADRVDEWRGAIDDLPTIDTPDAADVHDGLTPDAEDAVGEAIRSFAERAVESEDFPEPEHPDPEVFAGTSLGGHVVFIDVSDGLDHAKPALVADKSADLRRMR